MMRFANPWWLLLLAPIAGLGYLLWQRARQPLGLRFPEVSGVEKILPKVRLNPDELLGAMFLLSLVLLTLALARPQTGLKTEQISGRGVDIMICLDTSGSMRSVDFKPQNRLGAAKEVAQKFIQDRARDRIGLVVFGGMAITSCPLTTDKRALSDYLKQVSIDMTGVDGTAIGMAIALAADRLRDSKAASRVILLLTDGRNNQGAIDPVTAAKAAGALGIKVYTVGAGAIGGGLMPVQDPLFGTRYVRIEEDLDEDTLRSVAGATGGQYFRAKDLRGLENIFNTINHLEKSEYKILEFTHYRDLYFGWLLAGMLLLLLGLGLQQTVYRRIP